jgi:hypothetical protein
MEVPCREKDRWKPTGRPHILELFVYLPDGLIEHLPEENPP